MEANGCVLPVLVLDTQYFIMRIKLQNSIVYLILSIIDLSINFFLINANLFTLLLI